MIAHLELEAPTFIQRPHPNLIPVSYTHLDVYKRQDGEWKLRTMLGKDDGPPCFEIASDHWCFLSRSIDSQFPQWKTVLPSPASYQTTISINPEAVDEVMVAVQRLPLGEDKHHTIGLEVDGNAFRLLGRSRPELAWTKIDIQEAGATGPEVTIFLDRRTLLKALRFGLTRIEICLLYTSAQRESRPAAG